MRISIEDDGRGFDMERINEAQGFGLRPMRGGAEAAGGLLEVDSSPGKGTRVSVSLPLRKDGGDRFVFQPAFRMIKGEAPLSTGLAARVLGEFSKDRGVSAGIPGNRTDALTPRQMQVLTLVAQGLTYKEIRSKLFLTERTIKYHLGEIIERLHLDNRRQWIEYAKSIYADRL